MRKITKLSSPPKSFTNWVDKKPKAQNENEWFQELYKKQKWEIINELSVHNTAEQFYVCAYCCDRIEGTRLDTVNEHVIARAIKPERSLDHTNIVASCKTKGQCDDSHKGQPLPLTPFMDESETELKFKISGRVEGLTTRATEAIKVLNLGDHERNNKALIEKRKQLSANLLWLSGIDPNEGLEDEDLLRAVIDDLKIPQKGRLEPFAPVVANILKTWINQ